MLLFLRTVLDLWKNCNDDTVSPYILSTQFPLLMTSYIGIFVTINALILIYFKLNSIIYSDVLCIEQNFSPLRSLFRLQHYI